MTNGVGFLKSCDQPCLVWNNNAAPWPGVYSKVINCHKQTYKDWAYVDTLEEPHLLVIIEGLIRWEDE